MKMNIRVVAILSLVLALALTQPLQAQDEATAQKVRQQVVQMMQEMPLDAQLEVLKFTQRKQTEMNRRAAAQATDRQAAPQQAQARPAPTPPKTVAVKPANQPTAPNQPARPAYMEQAESMPQTTVDWGETNHDFGNIKSGEVVKHTYRFTNAGDQPLKLTRVKASCGCTTPSWSKEAIAPGEEGFIEVAFNTRGKSGPQRKTVVVNGNFEPTTMILRFQGEVVKE
jgi:hypothetical protein